MPNNPHLTLGTGRVHYATVNPDGIATNRPVCGAGSGSRRPRGAITDKPVNCAKCEAIAANELLRPIFNQPDTDTDRRTIMPTNTTTTSFEALVTVRVTGTITDGHPAFMYSDVEVVGGSVQYATPSDTDALNFVLDNVGRMLTRGS